MSCWTSIWLCEELKFCFFWTYVFSLIITQNDMMIKITSFELQLPMPIIRPSLIPFEKGCFPPVCYTYTSTLLIIQLQSQQCITYVHIQARSQTLGGCGTHKGDLKVGPDPPHKTPFLGHFVAKSGPFGRSVVVRCTSHTPTPTPLATGLCTSVLPLWININFWTLKWLEWTTKAPFSPNF